jgi:predicted phosphodiesterase
MRKGIDRRDFLKLAGMGTVVFVSGFNTWGRTAVAGKNDFFFVQMSDTHWGFANTKLNGDPTGTLKKAIAGVNSLRHQPDFVVFTGDITHNADDDAERRRRMTEVRGIMGELKVKDLKFVPGENDASLDEGKAFQEIFGKTYYSFDHKGVRFLVLDNVSNPRSILGDTQLEWLAAELKKLDKTAPIIVFTHRPLFDLYPGWDWLTRDGGKAIDLLMPYRNVTVFYGHIHQEHHHKTGHIAHHAAKGLMWVWPAPGSVPEQVAVPWAPDHPYKGLGFRSAKTRGKGAQYQISEYSVEGEVVK